MPTLLDVLIKRNATEMGIVLNEAARPTPELNRANEAQFIEGTKYISLVVESLPTQTANGSAFIKVNNGVDATHIGMVNREFTCFPIEARIEAPWSAVAQYPGGMAGYLDDQAPLVMTTKLMDIASDFHYANPAVGENGFKGVMALAPTKSHGMVVDAGGDTAGGCTNVIAVRWDRNSGLVWTAGQNGMFSFGEIEEGLILGANGKMTKGAWRSLTGHLGLAAKSVYSVGRLANIDADHTLTDEMLDALYNKFQSGFKPSAFYLTKKALTQLKNSRTATNPTGAPAAWPTSYISPEGEIPLIVTDNIRDTDDPIS